MKAEGRVHLDSPFEVHIPELDLSKAELTILSEICLQSTQILDIDDILSFTIDTYTQDLGMAVAMIYLQDLETGQYTLCDSYGLAEEQREEIARRRREGHDITLDVIETGREVFIPDMSTDPRFKGVWDDLEGRSYLKLPLISRGTIVGVLGLVAPPRTSITPRTVKFMKVVGHVLGIAIDNTLLRAQSIRGEQRAQSVYQLGVQVSSSLTLNGVLESVSDSARKLMEADLGLVGLMDVGKKEMVMQALSGRHTDALPRFVEGTSEQELWRDLTAGRPVIVHRGQNHPAQLYQHRFLSQEGIQSYLAVPLMQGLTFIGLLVVMYREPRRFTHADINLVLRFTHQVVLAIENARLYRQLHHLAALEERNRLARELHDDISQTLGYLKVKAAITEELLDQGNLDKVRESLGQLKKVSELLYTNVREEIFNLRTGDQEQQGFFHSLQDYLSKYRTHYGLQVELVIEQDCLQDVSPQVSCQLLRIIQEALSNVRKHAQASEVRLSCAKERDRLHVLVEDDGQGFHESAMAGRQSENYGMQIMRERAESIGGSLQVVSSPDKGTRVSISVPLNIES